MNMLVEEETKAIKAGFYGSDSSKRRKKNRKTKREYFFIEQYIRPVTGSPERTPPLSPGVFEGEVMPENPPSNQGSPSSTKNDSGDASGKLN